MTRTLAYPQTLRQPAAELAYEPMAGKHRSLYVKPGSNYQGEGLKLPKHFAAG